jgi:hypothetical protein
MDTRPAEYIRHRLVRFRNTIDETREHYGELSAFGRYYAAAPYYEKYGILMLLDGLTLEPGLRGELCTEFREVVKKLHDLEAERGEEYRALLRQDLHRYTDVYAAAVCHAQLGSIRFERDHDLFHRELITVLVQELEKDGDLADLRQLIRALDNNLFVPKAPAEHPGAGTSPVPGRIQCDPDQSPAEN